MITIIDYGAGNIKSIQNMLRKIGVDSKISRSSEDIFEANKLILPGVGHFDHGMKNLEESGVINALNKRVKEDEVPILGICLGAQLLGESSEEGNRKGLSWIPMKNVAFDKSRLKEGMKIPHMGWNSVNVNMDNQGSKLFEGLLDENRFYFVHSFHMLPNEQAIKLSSSEYGYEFASAVGYKNIFGVQFHPEKSHSFGMKLLSNFSQL